MFCHKSITIFLFATAAALCTPSISLATEQQGVTEETSFFERYTNSAQDLVLKGLELVGINYRRGGTDPEKGLDCSGFVQVVFRDAVGKFLPRTAKEQSQVGDVVADKKEFRITSYNVCYTKLLRDWVVENTTYNPLMKSISHANIGSRNNFV